MRIKRVLSVILFFVLVTNSITLSHIDASAHKKILDIEYDACVADQSGDGYYEMWYALETVASVYRHISHESFTIKYFFEDNPNTGYSWAGVPSSEEIKDAYANSMKKWNNVYFYSYDADGTITKNKVINIVEGTEEDHNLSIYPGTSADLQATTTCVGGFSDPGYCLPGMHNHYELWEMVVYVNFYYENNFNSLSNAEIFREKTGAHEIGHILGLRDIDDENLCESGETAEHHHELLMGYGSPATDRSQDITYKDIAGVAITRGFHTDDDHKWLYYAQEGADDYKLICSICNGVKYVDDLSEYAYDTYNSCGGNHSLSDGNMMAVASYGTKDYYKCKYCRYVAPFSSIVEQNYSKSSYSDTLHMCENTVNGLTYTFYEHHDFVIQQCDSTSHRYICACGETRTEAHYAYRYKKCDNSLHTAYCICGKEWTEPHVVSSDAYDSGNRFAPCLACGVLVNVGTTLHPTMNGLLRTENGSFILPDGIIVLVSEDIEAYFAGTLEFYYPDENLETE